MKLEVEFTELTFDSKTFTKALQKAIETQMRQAAREFVRAALALIPYRTGFLRGAFAPLLQLLKVAAPAPPAGSTPLTSKGKPKRFYREFYEGILKTHEAGAAYGTNPDQIFIVKNDEWFFNYAVLISYYRINDLFTGHSPSAPWKSLEAGEEAFKTYMRNIGVSKLPKITSFIMKTKIVVKDGTTYKQSTERVEP